MIEALVSERLQRRNAMDKDEKYMREAMKQAKKAWALDEVPIGWE